MVQQCSPRKWHGVPGRISWPSITPTTQPSQHAVHSPHWRPRADAMGITAPWHFLYFRPLPHGHGSLRPTDMERGCESRGSVQYTCAVVVYAAIFLSFLNGICVRGAKMLVSLSALDYGASSFEVGLIGATFPVFQLLLAVYAGRISDRIGVRIPLIAGSLAIGTSTAIPLAWPGIPGLVVAGLAIGCGMIFFQVSMHNLIGSYGTGDARTRNFATFSLGQSSSAFFG